MECPDPDQLLNEARCFLCASGEHLNWVILWLLCQIANEV
jgi:hypothetical protein